MHRERVSARHHSNWKRTRVTHERNPVAHANWHSVTFFSDLTNSIGCDVNERATRRFTPRVPKTEIYDGGY